MTIREGLCSHYLARQPEGSGVHVAVKTSTFRPPPDPHASPVIMV
ncbi:unnamed protein product, partial [Sphacelaria rigidula]